MQQLLRRAGNAAVASGAGHLPSRAERRKRRRIIVPIAQHESRCRGWRPYVPGVVMLRAACARLRRLRRSIKRWYAFRTADVVFLSPGKSGRTWVRAMLSHVYHLSYGTPADQLINRDRFYRLDRRSPRIFFSHGVQEPYLVRRQLTAPGLTGKTVICLVRDPRDVVVSYGHQRRHRSKRPAAGRASAPASNATDRSLLDLVAAVSSRVNRLRSIADAHERGHLFRYEDFHADPARELARLLRALDNDVPDAHIEAAVRFAAFDNLQRREAAGFFRSDNLRPGDAAQPSSFKVRRGKVGGYRDELTAEQVAAVDQQIDAVLDRGLGYRSDECVPSEMVPAPRGDLGEAVSTSMAAALRTPMQQWDTDFR